MRLHGCWGAAARWWALSGVESLHCWLGSHQSRRAQTLLPNQWQALPRYCARLAQAGASYRAAACVVVLLLPEPAVRRDLLVTPESEDRAA